MKFGVLSYHGKKLALDGKDCQNIGDWIQMQAMEMLLKECNINDYLKISRYLSRDYDGENVFLLFNGFNELTNQFHTPSNTFPLSDKIIPLFISFHMHSSVFTDKILDTFKAYQPIGCRDEQTMINMRKHSVTAYLSGCVTALFPKRENNTGKKILFIDTPKSLEEFIPENIKENIEYMSHMYKIHRMDGNPHMTNEEAKTIYDFTAERLEYYKKEAVLVVTSRLHAAAPCMAMGIPVILVADNFDGRFSWLDKYIPFYTPDKFSEINWEPSPVDYEEEKNYIKEVFKKHIMSSYQKYNGIFSVSQFYETRERFDYNKIILDGLKNLSFSNKKNVKYAIWGTVYLSTTFKSVIGKEYPEWKFVHALDKNCVGEFEGLEIERPEKTNEHDTDIIYFIVAPSAHKPVSEILRKEDRKYVLVNTENSEEWETNY